MAPNSNNIALKQETEISSDLPVLPPGIVHLLKALNNNDIHYSQLAKELENFPPIAIKIVAIANSAWALPETPITNLPDACSRIGLNIVRSVSIALSISQVFDPSRCSAFNIKTFWTSALLNAESAYICAKNNPQLCANTARFAGLLHNIGLLWLANQKPSETESAIIQAEQDGDYSLATSLTDRLDMNYYTVGGQLAMAMELPLIITDTIATENINGLTDLDPLTKNHFYAKKLTSSVLRHIDTENTAEYDDAEEYEADPNYQQLMAALPKIQLMAESIFTN